MPVIELFCRSKHYFVGRMRWLYEERREMYVSPTPHKFRIFIRNFEFKDNQ